MFFARWQVQGVFVLAISLVAGLWTSEARAGAWTQKQGEGLLLLDWTQQSFETPRSSGNARKTENALYAEYGFHDRVSVVARLAFEEWTLPTSVYVQTPSGGEQKQVTLSRQRWAAHELGARFQLYRSAQWASSVQAVYLTASEPLLDTIRLTQEAQSGYELRAALGRSLGLRSYFQSQISHRHAGVQDLKLDLTYARPLWGEVELMVQTHSLWRQADTQWPMAEHHRVQLSLIVPLSDHVRLQMRALDTVSSDGLATERAYGFTLWRRF